MLITHLNSVVWLLFATIKTYRKRNVHLTKYNSRGATQFIYLLSYVLEYHLYKKFVNTYFTNRNKL